MTSGQRIWGTPNREYGEPAGTPANPQVKAGHKTPTGDVSAHRKLLSLRFGDPLAELLQFSAVME